MYTNSEDPGKTLCSVVSDLDLYCLPLHHDSYTTPIFWPENVLFIYITSAAHIKWHFSQDYIIEESTLDPDQNALKETVCFCIIVFII